MRQLKALKKAIENGNTDEAKLLINELIEDTQKKYRRLTNNWIIK